MDTQQSDRAIMARLEQSIGRKLDKRATYDKQERAVILNLFNLNLTCIPMELVQLSNLRVLNLSSNKLRQVPAELGQISTLRVLVLSSNKLRQVPAELGQLSNLEELDLSENELRQVPVELGQLSNLQRLYISENDLRQVPAELGQISTLQWLDLSENDLRQVPAELGQLSNLQDFDLRGNKLSQVPAELGQLSNLRELNLSSNELRQVSEELGQLSNLQRLYISENKLSQAPAELGRLSNLRELGLSSNELRQVPAELGRLSTLHWLDLSSNELRQVPAELGRLSTLHWLDLSSNELSQVPAELGRLSTLRELDLSSNKLRQVPAELGQLSTLWELDLRNNPLLTPPPEIVSQGTQAVIAFLRDLQQQSTPRFEAKLLIVGEGDIGKTSLLRSLRGEGFIEGLSSTHGIDLGRLPVPHPQANSNEIVLNTWDFGGQHIYHATHQFFLTTRSLYLVVWNARLGPEPCKLSFWLNTIKALAPDAPVLLVATHTEDRPFDFNDQVYRDAYPQIRGSFSVSNKHGTGINVLKEALAHAAADIQLMGQPWPHRWLVCEKALLELSKHHIYASDYQQICEQAGIEMELARGTLGSYLHDLGKILYFRDDYVLSNLIILKPNWITKAISLVLEDKETCQHAGILSHASLSRIWYKDEEGKLYDPQLYPVFLRLMERFDLSYQIPPPPVVNRPSSHSLIPQLLPEKPPLHVPAWPHVVPVDDQRVAEMRFRLSFVPAGIMPWFIVRTHEYTQNLHWREGAVLQYEHHIARVELNHITREIRVAVWGVLPHNFFNILKNTMDDILRRFPGLIIQRLVPCNCHIQRKEITPCSHLFRYETLEKYVSAGKDAITCDEAIQDVSVADLLYGIHPTTTNKLIEENLQVLQQRQQQILQHVRLLPDMDRALQEVQLKAELIYNMNLKQWNFEMQQLQAECPGLFILRVGNGSRFDPKHWISQVYHMHLLCQYAKGPHETAAKPYVVRESKEWWAQISPWLLPLARFLKDTLPLTKAVATFGPQPVANTFSLLEEIAKLLPASEEMDNLAYLAPNPHLNKHQQARGPALRALYAFLHKEDPMHDWGGLTKTVARDGSIYWLCEQHRQEYEAPPLDPSYIEQKK